MLSLHPRSPLALWGRVSFLRLEAMCMSFSVPSASVEKRMSVPIHYRANQGSTCAVTWPPTFRKQKGQRPNQDRVLMSAGQKQAVELGSNSQELTGLGKSRLRVQDIDWEQKQLGFIHCFLPTKSTGIFTRTGDSNSSSWE